MKINVGQEALWNDSQLKTNADVLPVNKKQISVLTANVSVFHLSTSFAPTCTRPAYLTTSFGTSYIVILLFTFPYVSDEVSRCQSML